MLASQHLLLVILYTASPVRCVQHPTASPGSLYSVHPSLLLAVQFHLLAVQYSLFKFSLGIILFQNSLRHGLRRLQHVSERLSISEEAAKYSIPARGYNL